MKSSRDSLVRSVRLMRRTATVTICDAEASSASFMSANEAYFPVPTMRRDVNARSPKRKGSAVVEESDSMLSVVVLMRSPVTHAIDSSVHRMIASAPITRFPPILSLFQQGDVVDQARLPRPDGGAERRPGLDPSRPAHRVGRDDLDVVHRESGGLEIPAGILLELLDVAFSRRDSVPRLEESGREPGRQLPLVGREIGVSRGEGEAIRLSDRVAGFDRDREIQIARHPPDHGDLLQVFLAKKSEVGLNLEEELSDDGGHSSKVAGPRGALPAFADAGDLDRRGEIRGIEHAGVGQVEQIRALRLEQGGILLAAPGITVEILPRRELERIDENRNNRQSAHLSRPTHEREMTFVQSPHRGDETDRLPFPASLLDELPKCHQFRNGFHRVCPCSVILSGAKDLPSSLNTGADSSSLRSSE